MLTRTQSRALDAYLTQDPNDDGMDECPHGNAYPVDDPPEAHCCYCDEDGNEEAERTRIIEACGHVIETSEDDRAVEAAELLLDAMERGEPVPEPDISNMRGLVFNPWELSADGSGATRESTCGLVKVTASACGGRIETIAARETMADWRYLSIVDRVLVARGAIVPMAGKVSIDTLKGEARRKAK